MKIAIICSFLEWLLFFTKLYFINKFSLFLFIIALVWTIWSVILIPKVRKQIRYEKKLKVIERDVEEIVDEEVLNLMDISVIERYLRKKKLNNIQKNN